MQKKILLKVFFGLLISLMGLSMYQNPELTWGGLTQTFIQVLRDISTETLRLGGDPIALLGLTLMIFGVWFTVESAMQLLLE